MKNAVARVYPDADPQICIFHINSIILGAVPTWEKQSPAPLQPSTGQFSMQYGMPCSHDLLERYMHGQPRIAQGMEVYELLRIRPCYSPTGQTARLDRIRPGPPSSPVYGSVVHRADDNGTDTDPDSHIDWPGKRLESFHSPAALSIGGCQPTTGRQQGQQGPRKHHGNPLAQAQRTVNGLTVPPARGGRGGKAQGTRA
ncbi:hypothetical protein B0T26DRAFT_872583, partial [Lasiosphaeria miniovina]